MILSDSDCPSKLELSPFFRNSLWAQFCYLPGSQINYDPYHTCCNHAAHYEVNAKNNLSRSPKLYSFSRLLLLLSSFTWMSSKKKA